MKNIFMVLSFVVFSFFVSGHTFASENNISQENKSSAEVTFLPSTEHDSGKITPYITVSGPAGVARLDFLPSAKQFTWSAKPNFGLAYYFSGQIIITNAKTGGLVGEYPVSGFGAVGSSVGGDIGFSPKKNVLYTATLTGHADDIDGLRYTIAPGCSVPVYVSN